MPTINHLIYLSISQIFWLGLTLSFAQPPDLILTNGKFFTSDTNQLYVQALAIQGNRIVATGSNAAIQKLSSPRTKRLDLQGRTVVAGFNDAHDHLGWKAPVGQIFHSSFSVSGSDKTSVLDSVARLVKRAGRNQWISGEIGLKVFYDSHMQRSLDSIAPDHPVLLQLFWGHGMVLNSKALALLKIDARAPDPVGGWYRRHPGTDTMTGALYEYAQWPAWEALAISEPANLIQGLQSYAQQQITYGITTVQHMSSVLSANTASHFFKEARLPLRVRIIPFPGTTTKGRNVAPIKQALSHPSPLSYVSGVKYMIDGTPLEQTALMKKPYPDKPQWYGRLDFPIDTIRQILQEAFNSHTQLMMHIVGDSSLSTVLSLMEKMGTKEAWKTKRVRMEHNPTSKSTLLDRKRIREMGIIMTHTPQYGHDSPIRSLIAQGIQVVMAPDGLTNPFVNILIVSSQQTDPKENISREQAVIAYTLGTAYAEFKEKEKGLLKPGMLADLAVLSQDIFTVPAQLLPATRSVLTMVDGKIIYQQP